MSQDRFEQFRDRAAAETEYRKAYSAMAQNDPEGVKSLPHPDSPPADFDPVKALASLRNLPAANSPTGDFKTVPSAEVRT